MRNARRTVAGLVTCGLATLVFGLAAAEVRADESTTDTPVRLDLEHKTYRSFDLHLPAETWKPVAGGFELPQAPESTFRAELDGTALRVDTDGDGELDVRIERDPDVGIATGLVKLRGEDDAGNETTYAVRVAEGGRGWVWSASGAARGRLGMTQLRVVDQDGDGRFDGWGEDALVLGTGNYASFLSRAIHVDGQLRSLDVAADGSSATLRPFEGETGHLDLSGAFDADAKALTVVLRSTDGAYSFDLAGADGPIEVPAGEYELHSGLLGLGEGTVAVRKGRSETLTVAPGETLVHAWGGPVRAEFRYARRSDEVVFSPDAVWFYGQGGEEYHSWLPYGKAPEFVVKERETAEEILRVKFPGSC